MEASDIPFEAYDFARACMLCNRCVADCPVGIRAASVVSAVRSALIEADPSLADQYRNYRCDLADSMFTRIRSLFGTEYDEAIPYDIAKAEPKGKSMFMPGCSLGNNVPALSVRTYEELLSIGEVDCMSSTCCGRPLNLIGLPDEFESYAKSLCERLRKAGIERIVTACPNCFYALPMLLEAGGASEIEIVALPVLLADRGYRFEPDEAHPFMSVSIHDACPDRFDGIFASALRRIFEHVQIAELERNQRHSMCCGSGGFGSVYATNICQIAFNELIREQYAKGSGALVTCCATCAAAFKGSGYLPNSFHYLELLLGCEMDMNGYYRVMDSVWNVSQEEAAALAADKRKLFVD
ncbi:MAG: (Fe-S)-binding protein [Coriobacteriales bacterium]|nr:(Fe-S)-binding protein [Coriobacteriales bacterium]